MTLRDRLSSVRASLSWAPRPTESRRDFLARMAGRGGYVPRAVYEELVELHDRVARLEEQVATLMRS